jgi:flagellar hook-associated protein 1 FlgK
MRDSASGVSLDEELTKLMTYQKAYEGAAKVINMGTQMLDTVLGLIR